MPPRFAATLKAFVIAACEYPTPDRMRPRDGMNGPPAPNRLAPRQVESCHTAEECACLGLGREGARGRDVQARDSSVPTHTDCLIDE